MPVDPFIQSTNLSGQPVSFLAQDFRSANQIPYGNPQIICQIKTNLGEYLCAESHDSIMQKVRKAWSMPNYPEPPAG